MINTEKKNPEVSTIDKINLDEDYEVQAWCHMFEITTIDLKRAIEVVGPSAVKVKHYLNEKNINSSNARV
jgi:hypothetical protein